MKKDETLSDLQIDELSQLMGEEPVEQAEPPKENLHLQHPLQHYLGNLYFFMIKCL